MKLDPGKKLDVEEVLRDLAGYRPRRKGWTWRNRVEDQEIGPFVYRDSSEGLERSVLLRMGLSSIEAKALVDGLTARGLLGHGAGRLLLDLADAKGITVREAADALLGGRYWEDIAP